MKPAIQTGLVAAAAGVLAASAVCAGFFWFVSVAGPEIGPDGERVSLRQRVFHGPPMSVSPPLVRPRQPSMPAASQDGTVPVAALAPLLVDLPSFAPLVRRVIPAVVNISLLDDAPPPPKPDRPMGDQTHATPLPSLKKTTPPASADRKRGDRKGGGTGKHHAETPRHASPHRSTPGAHESPHPGQSSRHPAHTPHAQTPHRLHDIHRSAPVKREVRPVDDESTGAGSGFIIDPSGIIVTNRHVVGEAAHVSVALSDGRVLHAHLLGDDPMTDIAVIKVESETPLPWVSWGDSRLTEIGDWIMVAGNPFGFGSSVTAGIVSAVGRDLGIGALDNFMQLDAPINPGNSGGPAFNLRGEVIAVNAAIASPSDGSVGIGFGIPAEIVSSVVNDIVRTGHVEHGWLGITLNDASAPMWVEDVDSNGAAWKGGLRRGDEILSMGDVPVQDARTVLRSVAAAHPDTVFNFTIRRQGAIRTLAVKLGKRPITD